MAIRNHAVEDHQLKVIASVGTDVPIMLSLAIHLETIEGLKGTMDTNEAESVGMELVHPQLFAEALHRAWANLHNT